RSDLNSKYEILWHGVTSTVSTAFFRVESRVFGEIGEVTGSDMQTNRIEPGFFDQRLRHVIRQSDLTQSKETSEFMVIRVASPEVLFLVLICPVVAWDIRYVALLLP